MGFQAAVEYARDRATELKGRWRQITSEPWGSVKGADWFAEVEAIDRPLGSLEALRKQVANLEGQLAGLDGQIGVARREQATAVQRAGQERLRKAEDLQVRQEAERRQARIAELRTIVAGEAAAREEHQAAVEALAEATQSWNKAQAATVPADVNAYAYTCGSCGQTAVLVHKQGAKRTALGQPLIEWKDEGKADLRIKHIQAKRLLAEAETKLRSIETAHEVLDELLATQGQPAATPVEETKPIEREHGAPVDPELALFTIETKRSALALDLQDARVTVRRVEDYQERVAQAKQRTTDAAALHSEIETWLRLAEDLSPEGIPAQLLHQAIDPINTRLAKFAEMLGFESLELTAEMELVGRPEENDPETPRRYELVSGSAQWRMEAALADAIGVAAESWWYSGSCKPSETMPLVLDRFDVLDGPNRGRAIKWLLSLGRQVILLGTLRNRDVPQELPHGVTLNWLQAGTLMGAE